MEIQKSQQGKKLKFKELEQAEQQRLALIQMYRAGWLDGFNNNNIKKVVFTDKLKKLCLSSFEKRFKKIKKLVEIYENGRRTKKRK